MRTVVAGWRRQWDVVTSQPDYWMTLITMPLLAVVFLAIMRSAGRDDLLSYAVLAPGLIGMWATSLFISGEVIARDRDFGLLELTLATPSSYAKLTIGRIGLVTTLSLVAFVQSWLVALVLFQVAIPIPHPAAFGIAIVASAFAMTGTALMMSVFFIRSTSVRRYQNALSYPFYVLGGVLVPVALLPLWLEPFTRVIFLSWSSDVLRDSLNEVPIEHLASRLLIIVILGAAAFAIGGIAVRRMIDRIRMSGEVGFS